MPPVAMLTGVACFISSAAPPAYPRRRSILIKHADEAAERRACKGATPVRRCVYGGVAQLKQQALARLHRLCLERHYAKRLGREALGARQEATVMEAAVLVEAAATCCSGCEMRIDRDTSAGCRAPHSVTAGLEHGPKATLPPNAPPNAPTYSRCTRTERLARCATCALAA